MRARSAAFAIYATGLVLAAGSSMPALHAAAALVGLGLALGMRRRPTGRWSFALAGVGLVQGSLGWLLGPSDAATMARAFLRRPEDYVRGQGAGMAEGAVRTLLTSAGTSGWAVPAIGALVGVLALRMGERAWRIPAAGTPLLALTGAMALAIPTTAEGRWAAAVRTATDDLPVLEPLPRPTLPELAPAPGRKVAVISVESIGADAVRVELAAHPDEGLARLIARGAYFPTAVAAANVSHLSQPALFTSHDFSHGLTRWFAAPDPGLPLISMAEYFHRKGLRTHSRAAEDQSWLAMDKVMIAGQPWDSAQQSADLPHTADACGVPVALDSVALDAAGALLDAAPPEGVYTWIVTQDSHWPYILEDSPERYDTRAQCWWFVDMPAEQLPAAELRYRAAVHQTFERLARFADAHPDTLIALAGDHGESMNAGEAFGHGKSTSAVEVESFFLLIGPEIEPAVHEAPVSLLDVFPTLVARFAPEDAVKLAPFWQGQDATAPRRGPMLTASHGFGEVEFALYTPTAVARRGPERLSCDGAVDTCADADTRLLRWLRCLDDYYADPAPDTTSPCVAERF